MTTEAAVPGEIADAVLVEDDTPLWPIGPDRKLYGHVIIEWPAPGNRDGFPRAMPAWGCSIFDAETGRPIFTVEKIAIPAVTADGRNWIIADLALSADADGMPILFPDADGNWPLFKDDRGRFKTGVFPFLVTEMRVRGSAPVVAASGQH